MNEKSLANLKKGRKFCSDDPATKICGSKGGTAKAANHKKRKTIKALIDNMSEWEIPDKLKRELIKNGFTVDENIEAIVAAVIIGARNGDPNMVKLYMAMKGQDIAHEELALKKKEFKLKEKAASDSDTEALAKLDEVLKTIGGGF